MYYIYVFVYILCTRYIYSICSLYTLYIYSVYTVYVLHIYPLIPSICTLNTICMVSIYYTYIIHILDLLHLLYVRYRYTQMSGRVLAITVPRWVSIRGLPPDPRALLHVALQVSSACFLSSLGFVGPFVIPSGSRQTGASVDLSFRIFVYP